MPRFSRHFDDYASIFLMLRAAAPLLLCRYCLSMIPLSLLIFHFTPPPMIFAIRLPLFTLALRCHIAFDAADIAHAAIAALC